VAQHARLRADVWALHGSRQPLRGETPDSNLWAGLSGLPRPSQRLCSAIRAATADTESDLEEESVPIRLTQTATICSGANDKLQGSWSEGIVAFESRVVQK